MKKTINSKNDKIRLILEKAFGDTCMKCRKHSFYPITNWIGRLRLCVDHIIPKSKGGNDDIRNRQLLCHACNAGKKDKTVDYRPKGWERKLEPVRLEVLA